MALLLSRTLSDHSLVNAESLQENHAAKEEKNKQLGEMISFWV